MEKRAQRNTRSGSNRQEREKKVLFALVEHYLKTGKPVGSQSLQEAGLPDISSATIRNYFASLEEAGYVKQQHFSGGRVPQAKAFSEYAKYCYDRMSLDKIDEKVSPLQLEEHLSTSGMVPILQNAAESLSHKVGAAVAISSPRFDHDIIVDVKFIFVDIRRCLVVIITEFGLVHTAVLWSPFSLSHTLLRKADRFARSRLFHEVIELDICEGDELEQVRRLYQEAMANYFVSYSNISQEDMWRTGFARILQHSEVEDSESVVAALALFENETALRGFTREAVRANSCKFWVGEDLRPYLAGEPRLAVVTIPYHVGDRAVGAITVVGSMNIFYLELFRLLRDSCRQLSTILTRNLMHNRMTYRMPEDRALLAKEAYQLALCQSCD